MVRIKAPGEASEELPPYLNQEGRAVISELPGLWMRGSSPASLSPRAWRCLKSVRVSVGEARAADPKIEPPPPLLASCRSPWNVTGAQGLDSRPVG